MKPERIYPVLLLALVAMFGAGVVRLFQLRFETGDVFPPYSSLRADPLGTRAFYESLQRLPGLTARRFTGRLNQLPEGRGTTLFVPGVAVAEAESSTEEEYQKLEQFMSDGGRIVVSLAPMNTRPWAIRREEAGQRKKVKDSRDQGKERKPGDREDDDSGRKRNPPGDEEDSAAVKRIPLKDRWNVSLGYEDLPRNADEAYQSVLARRNGDLALPATVVWHTALYFDKPATNWNVLYVRDGHPVLIERRFGQGTLVFSADSYFLSNEALRAAPQPDLLAWLVGPNHRVLFDETHLGVMEEPGVAALVRKYRLHGFVIGLVLSAGLFVWKNTARFVPAYPEELTGNGGAAVVGKDSAAGFVNLLRRSIAPAEILPVCFAEWNKIRTRRRLDWGATKDRLTAVIAEEQARTGRERNPVEAYRRISRILGERK